MTSTLSVAPVGLTFVNLLLPTYRLLPTTHTSPSEVPVVSMPNRSPPVAISPVLLFAMSFTAIPKAGISETRVLFANLISGVLPLCPLI